MIDLLKCVRALGFSLGWRYWRIRRRAFREPALALSWARNCRREAMRGGAQAGALLRWADELEAAHDLWMHR